MVFFNFRAWLRKLSGRFFRRPIRHVGRNPWQYQNFKPLLEMLETRLVPFGAGGGGGPAILIVNTADDNTSDTSVLTLREAITLVNNNGDPNSLGQHHGMPGGWASQITGHFGNSGDTIKFDSSVLSDKTIILGGTELPQITTSVTITGLGASSLAVSGNYNSREFDIAGGTTVGISGLTIEDGNGVSGTGAAYDGSGGGIYNQGTLTLTDSTISGNSAAGSGGGIYNDGTLTLLTNSAVSGNFAGKAGGGISNSGTVTLSNSTISGNSAGGDGGGIFNRGTGSLSLTNSTISGNSAGIFGGAEGGAIYNRGTLALTNSTISGNSAGASGGGIFNNYGTLTLTNSTVSGNSAGFGGGIGNYGSGTLTNSTISGNYAVDKGGGISNFGNSTLTLTNSTVSSNSAGHSGGGIFNSATLTVTDTTISGNSAYYGGGIDNQGTLTLTSSTIFENSAGYGGAIANFSPASLTLENSIVAGNSASNAAPDIIGSITLDKGYNLVGTQVAASESGDVHSDQPMLAPLGYYGGTTQIMPPLPGSPAIDAGEPSQAGTSDQRGVSRVSGSVDIGAVEDTRYLVTNTYDSGTGSLRAAVSAADSSTAGPTVILFDSNLSGTITLTSGDLPITADVQIDGLGASTLAVSGNHASQVLNIASGVTVAISGLTIEDGKAVGTSGGGIFSSGTLTLTNCTLSGNSASYSGGGIENNKGALTLTNCMLSGNSASFSGGGIENFKGTLTLTNCTLSGNSAGYSGAGINNDMGTLTLTNCTTSGNSAGFSGGGIDNNQGTLKLTYSTISGNTAGYNGGGIENNNGTLALAYSTLSGNSAGYSGGGIDNFKGTLTLTGSTISGNSAGSSYGGGGISNNGTLMLTNSTVSGNSGGQLGGGIESSSSLTLTNSTISGNSAGKSGGGIFSSGSATLTNSTVSNNYAGTPAQYSSDGGGGIFNSGTLTLTTSTISGNSAAVSGGGIENKGTLTLTNSTISGNSAGTAGGGILNYYKPSSSASALLAMSNTIVAGNSAAADVNLKGAITTDNGYNLFGDTSGGSGFGGSDVIKGAAFDAPGTVVTALGYYGGPTQTMALVSGSPAIGTGSTTSGTDQRGFPLDSPVADIGAFQTQALPFQVNTADDTATGAEPPGELSLRDAINLANAQALATITFASSLSGTSITLAEVELPQIINGAHVTITGPGAGELAISADDGSRVFDIASGGTLSLSGLTIEYGNGQTYYQPSQPPGNGGGITNAGYLTITNSTLTGNTAFSGGAIYNAPDATVILNGSTVSSNVDLGGFATAEGGAIDNQGTLQVNQSTISGNTSSNLGGGIFNGSSAAAYLYNSTISGNTAAVSGGGLYNSGYVSIHASTISGNTANGTHYGNGGGGIANVGGTLLLSNSTLAGNYAYYSGGAVFNNSAATLTLTDSTVSGNSALNSFGDGQGGGIANHGQLTLQNTIVAGNTAGADQDINGAITTDNGHNLLGTALYQPGSDSMPSGNGPDDVFSDNPDLAPLGYYGGPTQTMALLPGSPAIGKGSSTNTTDQRGFPLDSPNPDIGSFQSQGANSLVVNTTDDTGNGAEPPATLSLRDAINLGDAVGAGTITFAIPTTDSGYDAGTGAFTIHPAAALPDITSGTSIDGTSEASYLGQTYSSPIIVIRAMKLVLA